jgi:hypothetical protein
MAMSDSSRESGESDDSVERYRALIEWAVAFEESIRGESQRALADAERRAEAVEAESQDTARRLADAERRAAQSAAEVAALRDRVSSIAPDERPMAGEITLMVAEAQAQIDRAVAVAEQRAAGLVARAHDEASRILDQARQRDQYFFTDLISHLMDMGDAQREGFQIARQAIDQLMRLSRTARIDLTPLERSGGDSLTATAATARP